MSLKNNTLYVYIYILCHNLRNIKVCPIATLENSQRILETFQWMHSKKGLWYGDNTIMPCLLTDWFSASLHLSQPSKWHAISKSMLIASLTDINEWYKTIKMAVQCHSSTQNNDINISHSLVDYLSCILSIMFCFNYYWLSQTNITDCTDSNHRLLSGITMV